MSFLCGTRATERKRRSARLSCLQHHRVPAKRQELREKGREKRENCTPFCSNSMVLPKKTRRKKGGKGFQLPAFPHETSSARGCGSRREREEGERRSAPHRKGRKRKRKEGRLVSFIGSRGQGGEGGRAVPIPSAIISKSGHRIEEKGGSRQPGRR